MKIREVKVKNFRGYRDEISISFQDLNVFVGKNDAGKSTILEALDIFFNENRGTVKLDKEDINKAALNEGDNEITISVIFEELPTRLIIDSTNHTTLDSEFLLNQNNYLEIIKRYSNAGNPKVFIKANHPTNSSCSDLLLKKQRDLRAIINENSIDCEDHTRNAVMRNAIWGHFQSDLQLGDVEVDVTKGETKNIWDKLSNYLPLYTLFQSDRKNSDGDSEVQDPMQIAVKEILGDAELRIQLNDIAGIVEAKLREVASNTLEKLREMNPDIANSLNPVIPPLESLKWKDVFKNVAITGDEDIPINKRGSGVKRLVLLNFFRAEAERRRAEQSVPSIVYAIEEPETSQHSEHQRQLIKAFLELSRAPNTQILLTTHSPVVVKELEFSHLKMVVKNGVEKTIIPVEPGQLPYPSLNEVNYLSFREVTEEYHNELYGYIENEELLNDFRNGKARVNYIKQLRSGSTATQQIILTEYIRHQIHHPENTHNQRYTHEQLQESISLMRSFIQSQS